MTHDELLAKIDHHMLDIMHTGFNDYKAHHSLRAVVELHTIYGYKDSPDLCNDCSIAGKEIPYPCNTIRAIEKELS